MTDFHNRLKLAVRAGGFTIRDASIWFTAPYSTMWYWLHGEIPVPTDDNRSSWNPDYMEERLSALEAAIKNNVLPVPLEHAGRGRLQFIKRIRDGNHTRLSAVGTTK